MSGGDQPTPLRERPADMRSVLSTLYLAWGVIGASIIAEFGLLLYLQRRGTVVIDDLGGPLSPAAHLSLVVALAGLAALAIRALRARLRDAAGLARSAGVHPARAPSRLVAIRFLALSVVQWALAEALAVAGLVVALALQPAPRLALTLYFMLGLAAWLWSRPDPAALDEALRRAGAAAA